MLHTILFLSQYPALITGIIGAYFVSSTTSKKRYWGFFLWIISDICWALFGLSASGYGLVIMQLIFIFTSSRGMFNNREK